MTVTGQELAERPQLLDVLTGEVLPANQENAARVLASAREMKRRMDEVIAAATDFVVEESRRVGTKTFHTGAGDVVLSGGPSTEYDGESLELALRQAGCPEDRIAACVTRIETIDYKVDRNVVRQLAGANPAYAEAIKLCERVIAKSWRAKAT